MEGLLLVVRPFRVVLKGAVSVASDLANDARAPFFELCIPRDFE